MKSSPFKTILLAGFIAGLLDITAAIVILGKMNVVGVLKYIASGVLGKEAFLGGNGVALLAGRVLLHHVSQAGGKQNHIILPGNQPVDGRIVDIALGGFRR